MSEVARWSRNEAIFCLPPGCFESQKEWRSIERVRDVVHSRTHTHRRSYVSDCSEIRWNTLYIAVRHRSLPAAFTQLAPTFTHAITSALSHVRLTIMMSRHHVSLRYRPIIAWRYYKKKKRGWGGRDNLFSTVTFFPAELQRHFYHHHAREWSMHVWRRVTSWGCANRCGFVLGKMSFILRFFLRRLPGRFA